jgi:pimeloyl-ACP methyl ester carboxylesterase
MSAIILNGEIVHYEVLGRGRPVVFLHGWVGSWRYWIPSMQAISTSYRAYAIDLWGFGDTAKSTDNYALEQQAQLIENFLHEMGIGKVALVGHGLGSLVALRFTLDNAEIVDRLMLVGFPMSTAELDERLHNQQPEALANWLLTQDSDHEAARTEAPKADAQAIKKSLEEFKTIQTDEMFKSLDKATLLVHGQNDEVVRPQAGENHLPSQAHRIVFESSGHFPMLDETSKFNRLVADFLALEAGESPRQLQLKEEWKRRVR